MKFSIQSLFLLAAAAVAEAGNAGLNEACIIKWNAGAGKYQDGNPSCAAGLVCTGYDIDDGDQSGNVEYEGTCIEETCGGDADPGHDGSEATIRVTICHRTCSEKNPWVRITIDDDAWNGTSASGCGHMREHDVEEDCNLNVKDINRWGIGWESYADYLIKWHGTREEVKALAPDQDRWGSWETTGNSKSAGEKAYWFYWERACPYVRNDMCCDWDKGECCGDNPDGYIPSIQLQKKVVAGADAACPIDMTGVFESSEDDETVTITSGAPVTFLYYVKNTGTDTLGDITITDANGCTSSVEGSLQPGEAVCALPCSQNPTDHQPEIDATVTATGSVTEEEVSAKDPASVEIVAETPVPVIKLSKTVVIGELGSCTIEGDEEVDVKMGSDDIVTFCYKVTNTGHEDLTSIVITDANGCSVTFEGTLAQGESRYASPCHQQEGVDSMPQDNDATVVGTGFESGATVDDSDPAAVTIYTDAPTGAPVTTPTDPPVCNMGEMGKTDDDYCEGAGVVLLESIGSGPPSENPVIWGIEPTIGTDDNANSVKFKVDNPFENDADIYVQFHEKVGKKAGDGVCIGQMDAPGCNAGATEIEAICMDPTDTLSFSVVSIWFVTTDTAAGNGGAEVAECCDQTSATTFEGTTKVVEYTYEIHCICPMVSSGRHLRGLPFN